MLIYLKFGYYKGVLLYLILGYCYLLKCKVENIFKYNRFLVFYFLIYIYIRIERILCGVLSRFIKGIKLIIINFI